MTAKQFMKDENYSDYFYYEKYGPFTFKIYADTIWDNKNVFYIALDGTMDPLVKLFFDTNPMFKTQLQVNKYIKKELKRVEKEIKKELEKFKELHNES